MSTIHEDKIRAAYAQASVLHPLAAGYSKERTLSMLTEALELSSSAPSDEEGLAPLMDAVCIDAVCILFDARKLTEEANGRYPSAPLRTLIQLLSEAVRALLDFGMESISTLGLNGEPTEAERAVVEKILSV